MRIFWNTIIILMLTLIFVGSVSAEQILPNIEEGNHFITILYGGSDGEQYWYSFDQDLEATDTNTGVVFDLLTMEGFTPSRIYGWYRYNADFRSETPEYQDYILGTEFRLSDEVDPGSFYLFTNTERIRLSTPTLDIGTVGIGARWEPIDQFSVSVVGQYDMYDTYLIKLSVQSEPLENLRLNGSSWAILTDDDWGFWQIECLYPLNNRIDGIVSYEQSTRTDGVVMFGIQYSL